MPPPMRDPEAAIRRLLEIMDKLRDPGGCPWDREQTLRSLTPYLLEEAHEVIEAIEAGDAEHHKEELGDLLFQVVFQARIAREEGKFDFADVCAVISDKLVRRHPHVFGDVAAETASDVVRNWEQIKKDERGSDSLVDSVPTGLPALLYTHKLYRKAASVGLQPSDRTVAVDAIEGALDALRAPDAASSVDIEGAVGEVLAGAVALARAGGVDAESALRGWAARYRDHFQRMEALARARDLDLAALPPADVDALWMETASP